MTPFILKILLAAHITGGVIALLCAGGALVAKKVDPVTVYSEKVMWPE